MDHVPLLRLRLFRVGAVGSAALWRTAGAGALLGEPLAGCVLRVVEPGAGERTESDPVSLPATDACRRERRDRGGAAVAVGDLWGRGAGAAEFAAVVQAPWSGAAAVGEHVRDHGDDGACDVPSAAGRGCGKRRRESDRKATRRPASI